MTGAKCPIIFRNKESLVLFRQGRSSWIIAGSVNGVHGELPASPPPAAVHVQSLLEPGPSLLWQTGRGQVIPATADQEEQGKTFLLHTNASMKENTGATRGSWLICIIWICNFCFASKKPPTNPLHFLSRIQGDFRALQFEFQRKDLLHFIYSYTAALISESNNVWNHLNNFLFSTWIYQEERIYLKWA